MTKEMDASLLSALESIAQSNEVPLLSLDMARTLDSKDPLAHLRQEFHLPVAPEPPGSVIYLCGNSLGPQPRNLMSKVSQVLDNWEKNGLECQHSGFYPATLCDLLPVSSMARIVGAKENEIAIMGGLTSNLHLLLTSFYQPTKDRWKIMIEENVFPSDRFVVESQLEMHGFSVKADLVVVRPGKKGIFSLEDFSAALEQHGRQVAIVLLSGVHYFSGQRLRMKAITKLAHAKGCVMGWDLAHCAGNVPVKLHDWDVDFAAWCTYKYLCAGPGSMAAIFIHERHLGEDRLPKLRGWWGIDPNHKFDMTEEFVACKGANKYKLSNPPPVLIAMLMASLEVFDKVTEEERSQKQFLLTGYLELLLRNRGILDGSRISLLTPTSPDDRGCQLSLHFCPELDVEVICNMLQDRHVLCDVRKPSVIRVAPSPLYNTFSEVYNFVDIFDEVLKTYSEFK